MSSVGFHLIENEVNALWRLMDAREPGKSGRHHYRQVMRFLLLETREIQYYRAMAKRAKRKSRFPVSSPLPSCFYHQFAKAFFVFVAFRDSG